MGIRLYRIITGALYMGFYPLFFTASRLDLLDYSWAERMGAVDNKIKGTFDLWLHAVSVGEVAVLEAILGALLKRSPDVKVLLSSSTPQGLTRLHSSFGGTFPIIAFPIDFPQVVKRVLSSVNVKVFGCIETELWPNLILAMRSKGTRCMLLNGRISKRSFRRYRRLRSIFSQVMGCFSGICAISEADAQKIKALGADPHCVMVSGNAKFEALLTRPDPSRAMALKKRFGIGDKTPVMVLGSIRGGEIVSLIQGAFDLKKSFPHMVVIIVPRHLKRVKGCIECLDSLGVAYELWSDVDTKGKRDENWLVVDTIGPLYDLYGICDLAFVGGSLVKKGGQNLMEPASWSKPVLFGPYTSNFEEAATALKKLGGGIIVRNKWEFIEASTHLLKNKEARLNMGKSARKALETIAHGAATVQADAILNAIEMPIPK